MKNREKIETAIRTISAKLDEALERESIWSRKKQKARKIPSSEDYELAVSALKKQMEYEELEDQGKLLKLPVWTGATVWDNSFGKPRNYTVTGFSFGKIGKEKDNTDELQVYYQFSCGKIGKEKDDTDELRVYYQNYNGTIRCSCVVSEIGRTVFLTEEEAKAALKDSQDKTDEDIEID